MTNQQVQVSIIMPAYNAAKFIRNSVETVISQTFKDWELIIVDDCSSDHTAVVAKELVKRDHRIKYHRNSENKGVSHSRNRAIDLAIGEWIAILDADDRMETNRLEKLLAVAANESLDMVGDNQKWIDVSTEKFLRELLPEEKKKKEFFTVSLKEFLISISKIRPIFTYGMVKPMIKLEFLNQNRIMYEEEISFAEDAALYLSCLIHGAKFGITSDSMYIYLKRNKKNVSHSLHTAKNQRLINNFIWKELCNNKQYSLLPLAINRRINMSIRFVLSIIKGIVGK